MKDDEIYILGVGRNTTVYIDLVESCGFKVAGLYHFSNERIGESIHGYRIIDSNINLLQHDSLDGLNFIISVGDNKIRSRLAEQIRARNGTVKGLRHPSAIISKYAELSKGVVVHANAVIQGDVFVGRDSVISCNATVIHTSKIEDACYLAANSSVGAYINIMCGALIGLGATVVSGKVEYVGANSIVGAGAVVLKNVEPDTIVAGNPAVVIRSK